MRQARIEFIERFWTEGATENVRARGLSVEVLSTTT